MDKDKQNFLELEHRFDAPPDKIFEAWTNPTEMVRWWGPKEFKTTSFDADVREGGEWRAVMVGEDKKEMPHGGRYLTIDPPRLLVFTFRWEEPDATDTEMRVTFEPDGSGTKLTLTQAPFGDAKERDSHAEGWREVLAKLDRFLADKPS